MSSRWPSWHSIFNERRLEGRLLYAPSCFYKYRLYLIWGLFKWTFRIRRMAICSNLVSSTINRPAPSVKKKKKEKGSWPNICCSSTPFGLVCSLFAFQWPTVSVRTMARVSLTSCPLIRRQRTRKRPRPCGIRAGWRMEHMQTGCWFTHTHTHTHTPALVSISSHTHTHITHPAAPANQHSVSCRSRLPSCRVFPASKKARTISSAKCQERVRRGAIVIHCFIIWTALVD